MPPFTNKSILPELLIETFGSSETEKFLYRPYTGKVENGFPYGAQAFCYLTFLPTKKILIVTEAEDNTGMSITNAAVSLYQQIYKTYLDKYPDLKTWKLIEHYNPQGRSENAGTDTFDEVTFNEEDISIKWTHIPTEQFISMLK